MRLESLALKDFRNYEQVSLELDPGLNIFVGDNAQGKTNLLEAVYVLALSKSYRAAQDSDLIRHGAQRALAAAQVRKLAAVELGFVLSHTEKKRLLVNGKAAAANRFVGTLLAVLFSPDSLQLVKGAPADRRHSWMSRSARSIPCTARRFWNTSGWSASATACSRPLRKAAPF